MVKILFKYHMHVYKLYSTFNISAPDKMAHEVSDYAGYKYGNYGYKYGNYNYNV